jgi:hypothetical protein
MLSGCSSDSNDDITPTISGAGNMARSDRDRSGGGGKKAEMPNKEDKPSVTPETGKRSATFTSYGVRNGGRQAWRISQKGPAFGKKIKVVFSNGHTVYVNNTSQNYRERDGFVFKPGIGPNGEGISDTGTSHGGVYLHAPYGNSSKRVTFYF